MKKNIKSAVLSFSFLSAVILSASSNANASFSDGNARASYQSEMQAQWQNEWMIQQDWMVMNIWNEFGVEVKTKDYSAETMKQLRTLHDALKNNKPFSIEKNGNLILMACPRVVC